MAYLTVFLHVKEKAAVTKTEICQRDSAKLQNKFWQLIAQTVQFSIFIFVYFFNSSHKTGLEKFETFCPPQ